MAELGALFPGLRAARTVQVLKSEPLTSVSVVDVGGARLVLKIYEQPAWLRWRTLLMPARAAREWHNLVRVFGAGVPCVEALAWDEERVRGCVRRSALVTRFVAEAPSLKQVLTSERTPRRRRELALALGALVRRLHAAGVLGARITPRNVLVTAGTDPLVLLDLPAAVTFPFDLFATGRADLDLWDAACSPGRRGQLTRGERLRVVLGYHSGDRTAARSTWRRLVGRPRWSNQVRKAAWVAFGTYLRPFWRRLRGTQAALVPMRDFAGPDR